MKNYIYKAIPSFDGDAKYFTSVESAEKYIKEDTLELTCTVRRDDYVAFRVGRFGLAEIYRIELNS